MYLYFMSEQNELYNVQNEGIVYDLRIFYAAIVGKNLILINDCLDKKDYMKCFATIKNTFPIIYSRVNKSRDDIKKQYEEYIGEANATFNKYQNCYFRKSFEPFGVEAIESILRKLYFFLSRTLEVNEHYGSGRSIQGLY